MRDFANPVLLLIVMGLFSWKILSGEETPGGVELWLLTLCTTGFLVNGALSLARAFAHRKILMPVVWSCVYLILGSCAWVLLSQKDASQRRDLATCRHLYAAWKSEGASPFIPNAEGHTLLPLAAALGKRAMVQEILALPEAPQHAPLVQEALLNAAEQGHTPLLAPLLSAGASFQRRGADGNTPLTAAVLSGRLSMVKAMLQAGAAPNDVDAEGITPLMHAVMNDHRPMVRTLMEYGANPKLKSPQGYDAAGYSRSSRIDELLAQPMSPSN